MYESLRPLEKSTDLPRLPAPEDVLPLANPIAISIAPIEASLMMERFPIAWRRDGADWDLVALTGLVPEQESWKPALGDSGGRVIPLLLRAYPLALVDDGARETLQVMVDEPALYTPWHPAVRGFDPVLAEQRLETRLQALWTYAHSRRALQPVFQDLEREGGFVPWNLGFKSATTAIALDGFHVIDRAYMGSAAHAGLVRRHGWLAASLLSLHRVSQHRVNDLLRDLDKARDAA
jgi:hypothetical protein